MDSLCHHHKLFVDHTVLLRQSCVWRRSQISSRRGALPPTTGPWRMAALPARAALIPMTGVLNTLLWKLSCPCSLFLCCMLFYPCSLFSSCMLHILFALLFHFFHAEYCTCSCAITSKQCALLPFCNAAISMQQRIGLWMFLYHQYAELCFATQLSKCVSVRQRRQGPALGGACPAPGQLWAGPLQQPQQGSPAQW